MKHFFTLLGCIVFFNSSGQQVAPVFNFKTALTFNPSVLINTDNTAMIGAERRLQERLAVVLDAGYIFGTYYFENNALKGTTGFAFRPSLKIYSKRGKNDFFQFQIAYRQANYKMYDWLGKACVNGTPTYQQLQNFTYRKKTIGFNVLAGQLYRISNTVLLELYAGFGVKIKDQAPTEAMACYRNAENGFALSRFQTHTVTVAVPFGVKLVVPVK